MRMPSQGRMILLSGDELLADLVGQVARNRETEAAVQPVDERVHADHFAVDIAKRPAAVARIDRRVGLQIIRDRIAAGREQFAAAFPADHAVGESVIELERRADGKGELAHADGVAVARIAPTGKFVASILMTATSVFSSVPTIFA